MADFNKLICLASKLASNRGVTIQELLKNEEFEYNSRSSIYQDFKNLENKFGLTPEKTNELRGKSGREAVYKIDKDEWNKFKKDFFTRAFDTKDRRRLSFMLESIGSTSPLVNASTDDIIPKLNSILGEMEIKPSKYGGYFNLETSNILDKLLEAQETKELLYITYNGERKENFVLKCFVFSGGTYCYVMNKNGWAYMLSVPRIEKVESMLIKKDIPYPTPNVDIEKALSDPFGIIREQEEFDAVVRLNEWQGLYEKEKLWPDSVSIEKDGDSYLFKVRTIGAYWLKKWVLSLGMEAELLEPKWLRDEIREDIKSMSEAYN